MNENGIGVLFQYPSCILSDGDRIRVYAKRRADVASLAPPTTLHYVTEKRVTKGRHSMRFDCELFSERYVEYCFVYVSRAITGAVVDVRMVCLPTLPTMPAGGWGPWSAWTPCSESCGSGIRTRYRVCNDPSPRYGAAFCEVINWSIKSLILTSCRYSVLPSCMNFPIRTHNKINQQKLRFS